MQIWINFWNIIFWLSIMGFLVNLENFFKILLYSEIVWTVLYSYVVITGSINDDLTVVGTSFYILALAGLEFAIGLLIIILFKHTNKSILLNDKNEANILNKKKASAMKIYWNV